MFSGPVGEPDFSSRGGISVEQVGHEAFDFGPGDDDVVDKFSDDSSQGVGPAGR